MGRPAIQGPYSAGEKGGPGAVQVHAMGRSGDGQGDYLGISIDFPNTAAALGVHPVIHPAIVHSRQIENRFEPQGIGILGGVSLLFPQQAFPKSFG